MLLRSRRTGDEEEGREKRLLRRREGGLCWGRLRRLDTKGT
jgi:hypothetical protein